MRGFLSIILASGMLLAGARNTWADIYKFVDGAGHVFYTDHPGHAGYRRIIRTPVTITPLGGAKPNILGTSIGSSRMGSAVRSLYVEKRRRDFAGLIQSAADRYRLDPALLHAVIRAESSYNPNAVSDKGAVGLMQLMPATATRYGVRDRLDPVENIEGGARYLSDLLDMFESDVKLAVAAYNAGENSVKRHGYQVPPIQETRDYVVRVLDYYRRLN